MSMKKDGIQTRKRKPKSQVSTSHNHMAINGGNTLGMTTRGMCEITLYFLLPIPLLFLI